MIVIDLNCFLRFVESDDYVMRFPFSLTDVFLKGDDFGVNEGE